MTKETVHSDQVSGVDEAMEVVGVGVRGAASIRHQATVRLKWSIKVPNYMYIEQVTCRDGVESGAEDVVKRLSSLWILNSSWWCWGVNTNDVETPVF